MRVLAACSLGGSGHWRPLVPLLDAARAAGHEVAVVAPPALVAMIAEDGHEWIGGAEPAESEIGPLREQLPVLPVEEASELGERELFGRLAAGAMLPAMRTVVDRWRPDLILRDPCEHASTVVAVERSLPIAQVAITVAEGEWRSIGRSAPAVDAFADGASDLNHSMPFVTRFPVSLDPSPFPTTIRYHVPAGPTPDPLPDWWSGSTAPLVYVTFGTVLGFMSFAAGVYRVALEAVDGLDARVLLTVGRRFDLASLGTLPDNVHVEPWVDHDQAAAGATVVLSHGGSGTVYATLGRGVPMVNVPLFADQFTNAALVAEAAAGLIVERPPLPDGRREVVDADQVAEIRDALRRVLDDGSFAAQAARLRDEMESTPTPAEIIATLLGA